MTFLIHLLILKTCVKKPYFPSRSQPSPHDTMPIWYQRFSAGCCSSNNDDNKEVFKLISIIATSGWMMMMTMLLSPSSQRVRRCLPRRRRLAPSLRVYILKRDSNIPKIKQNNNNNKTPEQPKQIVPAQNMLSVILTEVERLQVFWSAMGRWIC